MKIIILSFPLNLPYGSGWISREITKRWRFSHFVARRDQLATKALWAVFGILVLPFLHPVFTRFIPFVSLIAHRGDEVWLDLSQTFGSMMFLKNGVAVCHDLQCHRPHRLKTWVRMSERYLLRRAAKVLVLSERDATIVKRLYKVAPVRVVNVVPMLVSDVKPFIKMFRGPVRRAAFLGSVNRVENRDALVWLVKYVLPGAPELVVTVIGAARVGAKVEHPRIIYAGYVVDVSRELLRHDVLLAPMSSRAGIKIKVLEALLAGQAVLGTRAAFSGLAKPTREWVVDSPREWVSVILSPPTFSLTIEGIRRAGFSVGPTNHV